MQMQWHAERVQQLDPATVQRVMTAMFGLGRCLGQSGLEDPLLELVKIRVSQINGCAFCLDMHNQGCASPRRERAAGVLA